MIVPLFADQVERSRRDLESTLAALRASGAEATGSITSAPPVDALVEKVSEVDGREAIILTRPSDSRVLLDRITVLADGVTTSVPNAEGDATTASDDIQRLLTVAVTQREAEKLRFAEQSGTLSIALLNDASKVERDKGVTNSNLFD